MRKLDLFAAAMLLATATPAFAGDPAVKPDESAVPSVSLSGGFDYSSGNYGDRKPTDILVGLTSLSVTAGDFLLTASVPYLTITGPSLSWWGRAVFPCWSRPSLAPPPPGAADGAISVSASLIACRRKTWTISRSR